MSQENVEIVQAAVDAINRGDWDAVFKDAAPSFEWDSSRAMNPDTRGGLHARRGASGLQTGARTLGVRLDRNQRGDRDGRSPGRGAYDPCPWPRRCRGASPNFLADHDPRREDGARMSLSGQTASPRSRGAVGARRSRRLVVAHEPGGFGRLHRAARRTRDIAQTQ